MSEEKYYFNGMFYKTTEDMLRAANEFANTRVNKKYAQHVLEAMCQFIIKAVFDVYKHEETNFPMISNEDFVNICNEIMYRFIEANLKKINASKKISNIENVRFALRIVNTQKDGKILTVTVPFPITSIDIIQEIGNV